MHTGSIQLPEIIRQDSLTIINIATMVGFFNIKLHMRSIDVTNNLLRNKLKFIDLQDLQKLSQALSSHEQIDVTLRDNIKQLNEAYSMFIEAIATPIRPCGAWITNLD
jgi:isopenicillin N synthase-like dioxygenase